jgi:hypothetical protein
LKQQSRIVIERLGHERLQQRAVAAFSGFDMNRVKGSTVDLELRAGRQGLGVGDIPLTPIVFASLE